MSWTEWVGWEMTSGWVRHEHLDWGGGWSGSPCGSTGPCNNAAAQASGPIGQGPKTRLVATNTPLVATTHPAAEPTCAVCLTLFVFVSLKQVQRQKGKPQLFAARQERTEPATTSPVPSALHSTLGLLCPATGASMVQTWMTGGSMWSAYQDPGYDRDLQTQGRNKNCFRTYRVLWRRGSGGVDGLGAGAGTESMSLEPWELGSLEMGGMAESARGEFY